MSEEDMMDELMKTPLMIKCIVNALVKKGYLTYEELQDAMKEEGAKIGAIDDDSEILKRDKKEK